MWLSGFPSNIISSSLWLLLHSAPQTWSRTHRGWQRLIYPSLMSWILMVKHLNILVLNQLSHTFTKHWVWSEYCEILLLLGFRKHRSNDNGLFRMGRNCPLMCFLVFVAKLGANAILGVSLAVCKAGAAHKVNFTKEVLIKVSFPSLQSFSYL